jgi:hypothetical protein
MILSICKSLKSSELIEYSKIQCFMFRVLGRSKTSGELYYLKVRLECFPTLSKSSRLTTQVESFKRHHKSLSLWCWISLRKMFYNFNIKSSTSTLKSEGRWFFEIVISDPWGSISIASYNEPTGISKIMRYKMRQGLKRCRNQFGGNFICRTDSCTSWAPWHILNALFKKKNLLVSRVKRLKASSGGLGWKLQKNQRDPRFRKNRLSSDFDVEVEVSSWY